MFQVTSVIPGHSYIVSEDSLAIVDNLLHDHFRG